MAFLRPKIRHVNQIFLAKNNDKEFKKIRMRFTNTYLRENI